MSKFVMPARVRRLVFAAAATLVVVVLLLSHTFGRALPTNNYRPLLPAAALSTGCFPLPGGAHLDLSHQIRHDADVDTTHGPRRVLRGQYNLVTRDEAERRLVEAFVAVGYVKSRRTTDGPIILTKPGEVDVSVSVTALPDTSEETLVRGEFVLELPVVAAAKDDPVCSDPKSTKRWAQ